MPFDDTVPKKLLADQRARKYKMSKTLSPDCESVIKLLLEPSATFRCTINQILRTKWLRSQIERNSI